MLNYSPLWTPSDDRIKEANLTRFMQETGFNDYGSLYDWSITSTAQFWDKIWDFCNVLSYSKGDIILQNPYDVLNAAFFPKARLNYAQNLLRRRDDALAIHFFAENGEEQQLTFKDLYQQVSKLVKQFQEWNIQPGDRIAGYLPNIPQTVIAMLAAASIGAIWSSCSPDFGNQSVIDRFSQIQPKILLIADGYYYQGKVHNCMDRLPSILESIPSIEHTVVISYTTPKTDHPYESWLSILEKRQEGEIEFIQLPFNHPLFIMFSSGTTGAPKCIVHGAGGTLLQHLKEHQLHCDIKPGDKVFYFTTCGWMMWNWLISALSSEATLILYDGSPMYPAPSRLFEIAEKTEMTLFGTSAKYLSSLQKMDFTPQQDLSALRTITSTGSPLASDTFEYVYHSIKKDVHLASISGGTDIISCFMLGNPIKPVYAGQLQGAGLGMKVEVFGANGQSLLESQGELVCTLPFPSRPLGFWNDSEHKKYYQTYFHRYPNTWHHGDFLERTLQDGFIIHGRSDATLNPGGVRIGTAEIYKQVEQIPEVLESLAVGQKQKEDETILLFVILTQGVTLTEQLTEKIKNHIRLNTTPRHVPARIIQVTDLPRTRNGKLAELAVRQILHGQIIKNVEALANPECLKQFSNFIND